MKPKAGEDELRAKLKNVELDLGTYNGCSIFCFG
jgi:hypothetical protein